VEFVLEKKKRAELRAGLPFGTQGKTTRAHENNPKTVEAPRLVWPGRLFLF